MVLSVPIFLLISTPDGGQGLAKVFLENCKAGLFVGSRLLCGHSTCRQCNIFLAVNRMTAFCHSPQSDDIMLGQSTAAVAQPAMKMWVRVPPEAEFVHMFVPTLAYSAGAELSYLGFG